MIALLTTFLYLIVSLVACVVDLAQRAVCEIANVVTRERLRMELISFFSSFYVVFNNTMNKSFVSHSLLYLPHHTRTLNTSVSVKSIKCNEMRNCAAHRFYDS